MTNVAAIVVITLATNREVFLHPSGEEKYVRTVISEEHVTEYQWSNHTVKMTATIPISTNVTRMVWKEAPIKIPRAPLEAKDFPSPVNKSNVNTTP